MSPTEEVGMAEQMWKPPTRGGGQHQQTKAPGWYCSLHGTVECPVGRAFAGMGPGFVEFYL